MEACLFHDARVQDSLVVLRVRDHEERVPCLRRHSQVHSICNRDDDGYNEIPYSIKASPWGHHFLTKIEIFVKALTSSVSVPFSMVKVVSDKYVLIIIDEALLSAPD